MKQYISFDIGGTNIKYGIINKDYKIIYHNNIPTEAKLGGRSIINRIIEISQDLKQKYQVEGIAISSAGIIDPIKGEVIYATDAIPNYIGTKIKEMVETATNLPCEVHNDVKCFSLCEQAVGNAKGCSDFITLTVGTGVGGAVIINNELYLGKDFSAGEWGRMRINGHKFEDRASITGLISLANKYIGEGDWDGEKIFSLYDEGHPQAILAVKEFYQHLAEGITNLIYIFNPEVVIIGGGITARKEKFRLALLETIKTIIEPKFLNQTNISLAKFKNDSGMIGALVHFQKRQGL